MDYHTVRTVVGLSWLLVVVGILPDATAQPQGETAQPQGEIVGVNIVPHTVVPEMRYRRPRTDDLAARVQLFVRGSVREVRFNGKTADEWLANGDWAWHDLRATTEGTADSHTVWTFNGKTSDWGTGNRVQVTGDGLATREISLERPLQAITAATFLARDGGPVPDTVVLHVVNDGDLPIELQALRIRLPSDQRLWQRLDVVREWTLDKTTSIEPHDKGFLKIVTGPLPLTYAAMELQTNAGSLWCHLRIKSEHFDIGGGWVGSHLTHEPYLRLLKQLHVNTGNIESVAGYTDNSSRYERYPIKLFNRLWPLENWDQDEWLPRIHAVEFLGEPQYGGGRPVPPQEVFDKLLPYRVSRLATSVTHSEERVWRWYAGLSDYPHYDAYRVVAPAADAWNQYDRWQGQTIRWGAPLEQIGDLCRNLRELNRPMPCAYWSQGPHDGWRGRWDGRTRRSPTPDELRSQAVHALSSRITSLYWFNLSLESLLAFPDTWDAITRVGREIRMLEPFFLEGDLYHFQRNLTENGNPEWDLSTLAAPDAALLFAVDTAYVADSDKREFVFGPPRAATFHFPLPGWLRAPTELWRVDADGLHKVPSWQVVGDGVIVADEATRDAIYITCQDRSILDQIERRRQQALAEEQQNVVERTALEAALGKS